MPALIRDADDCRSQWSWLVEASIAHHSEKPSVFGEIIEIYFPRLSQVDLRARPVRVPVGTFLAWRRRRLPAVLMRSTTAPRLG
jgi:hypothetical protein